MAGGWAEAWDGERWEEGRRPRPQAPCSGATLLAGLGKDLVVGGRPDWRVWGGRREGGQSWAMRGGPWGLCRGGEEGES